MKPALLYLRKYIQQNYQNNNNRLANNKQYKQGEVQNNNNKDYECSNTNNKQNNKRLFCQINNNKESNQSNKSNNLNKSRKYNKQRQTNKNSEQFIFRDKKTHQWQDNRVRQIYFKAPRSLNGNKLRRRLIQLNIKQECQIKRKQEQLIQERINNQQPVHNNSKQLINKVINRSQQQVQRYEQYNNRDKVIKSIKNNLIQINHHNNNNNIINNQLTQQQVKNIQKNSIKRQKQVRFIISPPIINPLSNQSKLSSTINIISSTNTPNINQQLQSNQSQPIITHQQSIQSELLKQQQFIQLQSTHLNNQIIIINNISKQQQQQPSQQTIKNNHIKKQSKSMKKLGYNTLFDYLTEMKKFQNIKKKQIKQTHYYPLACMTPETNQSVQYQLSNQKQKSLLNQKLSIFQKQIIISNNFNIKSIQLQNFIPNLSKSHQKQKSNFSKNQQNFINNQNKSLNKNNKNKKQNKFLLQYQQIIICNCANKKYFTYKLSQDTDYNSFFKFTTPLLNSVAEKQNNYLIGNKQAESLGLYFCCLINTSLGIRQAFFWIGQPLQYYRKDKTIQVIDNFLLDVKAFSIFQSDRIWVVDYHGRNSYVMKNLLTKCNQTSKANSSLTSSKKQKLRLSKRISLSMSQQLPNSETPQIFMSLLANFSQFGESLFVKKQRNNISTRGVFKMLYDSSDNKI